MDIATEDKLIQECLRKIEQQLGWGDSNSWSTQDFESLSKKIQQATGVNLSVATLKRLWGKIKYESRPTVTTLDVLARFSGHESWRGFRQTVDVRAPPVSSRERMRRTYRMLVAALGLVGAAAALVFFARGKENSIAYDPARFNFSSKTVVDEGVPNSVIFDYDASVARSDDSVFIQQSWDQRLSRQVARNDHQHTSIYYYPGYFEAKLRINQQVVKEHILLIKTAGWLPLIQTAGVPVYFRQEEAMHDGVMGLSLQNISGSNVPLQPEVPWTALCNITDFKGSKSDNFVFETALRNEYKEGAGACQNTVVRLQFKGPAIEIPLCAPGCVSEISFMDADGKKRDMSAFGCDFSRWVRVRCEIRNNLGEVFVDGKSAIRFKLVSQPCDFVGITYRFQGTGSVDWVKVSDPAGQVFYEESF